MTYFRISHSSTLANWQIFHKHINQFELYSEDDPIIDKVLHDLTYLPLAKMDQRGDGSQLKLNYYLSNEARALFKPMR